MMKKKLLYGALALLAFCSFTDSQKSPSRKGKDYALFFAVNNYQNAKIASLQNPIGDAKHIAQELQNSYGFQTEVVENPTYETIEQTLQIYNRQFATGKFDRDGQLLIFFSGHGAKQLTNGYFLPANANPDDLKRSAFNYKIWRDDIDALDCKHVLVAIDACYSGSFDPKFGMRNDGLFGTRSGELSEGQRLIAEHEKHKTRLFFTSGESEQPTPDKSDFAKKFMAALLSKGYDDGILSSSEMFSNQLEKAAPRPRTGDFRSDEAGSSFLFIVENTQNPQNTRGAAMLKANLVLGILLNVRIPPMHTRFFWDLILTASSKDKHKLEYKISNAKQKYANGNASVTRKMSTILRIIKSLIPIVLTQL